MAGKISELSAATSLLGGQVELLQGGANLRADPLLLALLMMQPLNLGIACSVGSSALTISLKGADGNDPSATNPVYIPFRNVTPATGTPSVVAVTAATSIVISSGSTLGAPTGSVPFKIWLVAFNDASTVRLGVILATTLASGVLTIYPLSALGIASSTAEGGAGAADTAQTFYTGTAVTSKAYVVLAALHYETGLTTAGTWDATPTRIQLFDQSVPLPGRTVQLQRTETGAVASNSSSIPNDDTIPQISEGSEYLTKAITSTSAANIHRIGANFYVAGAVDRLAVALFRDAVSDAMAVVSVVPAGAGYEEVVPLEHCRIAGSTSSITYRLRAAATTGSITMNGNGGARKYGGAASSYIFVEEIAA